MATPETESIPCGRNAGQKDRPARFQSREQDEQPKVGCEGKELGIPASTLSHHLERLKQVALVRVRRVGTFLWYTADTDALREVMNFLYEECCTRSQAMAPESVVQISTK
jgi:DNA-binding transcriptional ArsR family regulator